MPLSAHHGATFDRDAAAERDAGFWTSAGTSPGALASDELLEL